jgi:hypothetical protein
MEEWKKIAGYNCYSVSSYGRVRNDDTRLMLVRTIRESRQGSKYYRVQLYNVNKRKCKHYLVHRLAAIAFIPNPENKPEVNHKDLNTLNCHIDNLEWFTRKENEQYKAFMNYKGE